VGLERNEKTAIAREYYWKLPKLTQNSVVIVTDPMLATGGSILHVLDHIAEETTKAMRVVCVVAAPEGIKVVQTKYPEVRNFLLRPLMSV